MFYSASFEMVLTIIISPLGARMDARKFNALNPKALS